MISRIITRLRTTLRPFSKTRVATGTQVHWSSEKE
jgi:hypothetical protein